MISPLVAFFSCSFKDVDKSVNDYFLSIFNALGIICKNVSGGFIATPPEQARAIIEDSSLLIAVAVKRTETTSGEWKMPDSVSNEISIAFGLGKKMLIFLEESVGDDGFLSSYGTYHRFNRDKLLEQNGEIISTLFEARFVVKNEDRDDDSGFNGIIIPYTLLASDWKENCTYEINISGLLPTPYMEVYEDSTPEMTPVQKDAYDKALIFWDSQEEGKLTIKAFNGAPKIDLPIAIIINKFKQKSSL